jgi:hypothetical protein
MRLTRVGIICFLIALPWGIVQCTCNPLAAGAGSELLSFLRDDLAVDCCNCLARESTVVASTVLLCPQSDAGTNPDSGQIVSSASLTSPCLCGDDASSCREILNEGGELTLQGSCVQENGPCASACDGILAYP